MSHALDSIMFFIHPPLSIVGYAFIVCSLIFILIEYVKNTSFKYSKISLHLTWFFNFIGLITGMIWAEIVWGSYWSWDPKETITLLLFIFVCLSVISYEKNKKLSLIMITISLIIVVINILITLGSFGLHSYGS